MIKKNVQYTDFNGDVQNENIYFNLTKAEITELEFSYGGGLREHIEKITSAKNNKELIKLFKEILILSVGMRSDDGKRFIKNDIIREKFLSSEAYSTIFMELAFNEEAAIEFMTGVVPKDLAPNTNQLNIRKDA